MVTLQQSNHVLQATSLVIDRQKCMAIRLNFPYHTRCVCTVAKEEENQVLLNTRFDFVVVVLSFPYFEVPLICTLVMTLVYDCLLMFCKSFSCRILSSLGRSLERRRKKEQ